MGFASTGVSVCCFVREQLLWLELGALVDVPLGQSWSHREFTDSWSGLGQWRGTSSLLWMLCCPGGVE